MQRTSFLVLLFASCMCASIDSASATVTDESLVGDVEGTHPLSDILPAPQPESDAAFKPSGEIQAGSNYHFVTNNYGNWFGQYLRGEIQTDKDNRWNGEFLNQREFNSNGQYAAIGNTHIFNEEWSSAVNIGGGLNGDFLPRYRVDAFINRKWLEQRQLVTTFGIGEYKAMDPHRDQSLFFGGSYYFQTIPWILQSGIRINNSWPGNVNTTSEFVAVTQGKEKEHFITLRYGFGEEAYQILGSGQTLSDFHSHDISLDVKEWISDDIGITAKLERYDNPNYMRTGISLGLFKEF